jgi:hypothetical protein
MLRRASLKIILGTATLACVARDWLIEVAEAQGGVTKPVPLPTGIQVPTPRTVAEAIATHKAAAVSAFILANPAAANAATPKDKGMMVYLMGICPRAGDPRVMGATGSAWANRTLAAQGEYERAALSILRGIDRKPGELAEVMKAVGGRQVIEQKLQQLQNPEFRDLTSKALRPPSP